MILLQNKVSECISPISPDLPLQKLTLPGMLYNVTKVRWNLKCIPSILVFSCNVNNDVNSVEFSIYSFHQTSAHISSTKVCRLNKSCYLKK